MIIKLQVILNNINASSFCSTEKKLILFNLIKAKKMLKIISYIFLLFILISCGQPSELSSEDFGYKLEAGQVTYFGDPYSGYVKEKFTPDDWFEGEYKNGVRHGKIIHYHDFYNYEEKTTLRIKKIRWIL